MVHNHYKPVLLNSIETKMMKKSRIRKNKIDSEAIAKYLIISNSNTINMYGYPDLREYANTYFRIERKLTAVKNSIIRDLDLLYPGITSIVDINAGYFTDMVNNIDKIADDSYRVKYLNSGKYGIIV